MVTYYVYPHGDPAPYGTVITDGSQAFNDSPSSVSMCPNKLVTHDDRGKLNVLYDCARIGDAASWLSRRRVGLDGVSYAKAANSTGHSTVVVLMFWIGVYGRDHGGDFSVVSKGSTRFTWTCNQPWHGIRRRLRFEVQRSILARGPRQHCRKRNLCYAKIFIFGDMEFQVARTGSRGK